MNAQNIADEGDIGSDKDPCLLAEAAFEPNSPESRDACAIELLPDEPLKRAKLNSGGCVIFFSERQSIREESDYLTICVLALLQ